MRRLALWWALGCGVCSVPAADLPPAGWGIVGRLSWPEDVAQPTAAFGTPDDTGLLWLREGDLPWKEDPARRERMAALRRAGWRVSAVVYPEPGAQDAGRVRERARMLAGMWGPVLDAVEMGNEPDTGYGRHLPEGYATWSKAFHAGWSQASAVPAVMGGLGLPPGSWVEDAARCGVFERSPVWNLHYYGHAEDFSDTLTAHRRAARDAGVRAPLWVTECGWRLPPVVIRDPGHLAQQARYLVDCAAAARRAGVALFMPYALRERRWTDWALLEGNGSPRPALTTYLDWVRRHPMKPRPALAPPRPPARVILEWVPPEGARPMKASRSWLVPGGTGVQGKVRIWNFGAEPVFGVLEVRAEDGAVVMEESIQRIPPGELTAALPTVPVPTPGEDQSLSLRFYGLEPGTTDRLFVRLRRALEKERMVVESLAFRLPSRVSFMDKDRLQRESAVVGPWRAFNGLLLQSAGGDALAARVEDGARHPGAPPFMAAAVERLPDDGGFLVLKTEPPLGRDLRCRIDLVDRRGVRFSVLELAETGMPPGLAAVRLEDFSPYFWGRTAVRAFPRAAEIRQVQVRVDTALGVGPVRVELKWWRPVLNGGLR